MKRKFLIGALSLFVIIVCAVGVSACGGENNNDSTHTHSYIEKVVDPTCTERGYTLFECSCGENYKGKYKAATGHSFKIYESNNDATCQADGTKTARCERCGVTDTVSESGTRKVHTFVNYVPDEAATCYSDATQTAKCEYCNETHTKTVSGSMLSHNFEYYGFNNDATCSEDGTETSYCTMCGTEDTRVKEDSMLNHNWDYGNPEWRWYYSQNGMINADITLHCLNEYAHTLTDRAHCFGGYNDPNCVENGFVRGEATYNYDSHEFSDSYLKVIPALGHNFAQEFTVDVEATCTTDGSKSKHCLRCDETNVVTVIPAFGHDWDATWQWEGYKSAKVEVLCKNDESHTDTYDAVVIGQVTIATECEKQGEKKYTASVSNSEYTGSDEKLEVLSATGHFVATDKAIAATCYGDGRTEGSHCVACEKVFEETEFIEKLQHNFTNSVCENCGIIEDEAEALDILEFEPIYAYNSEEIIEYKVAGLKNGAAPEYLIIPSTYEGLRVVAIKSKAFDGCTSLKSVIIPQSVTSIISDSFSGCTSLKSVTAGVVKYYLPESVTNVVFTKTGKISSSDFSGCDNVESLTLSAGVTDIPAGAISNLNNLKEVIIDGNPKYHAEGVCIIETQIKTLISGCAGSVIPADGSVTVIATDAFKSCNGLKTILIPVAVKEIGQQAFAYCSGLDSIAVEKGNPVYYSVYGSVIERQSKTLVVGSNTSIIPDDGSVTSIGDYAFAGLSFTNMVVPDTIERIGGHSFASCNKLTEITLPFIGETLEVSENSYFNYIFGTLSSTSSGTAPYSLSKITITQATTIPDYAFYDCRYVSEIIYPDVTEIGRSAFEGCSSLTEIIIPASVTEIDASAFKDCLRLRTVYWNAEYCSRTGWGGTIFEGCNSLKTAVIDAAVSRMPNSAFEDCTSLNRVDITDLTKWFRIYFDSMYSNPLTYAHNLYLNGELVTELVIPEGDFHAICDYAFYNGTCITSLKMGDNIETIRRRAFYGCTSLNEITIGSGLETIEYEAFVYCPTSLEKITVDEANETYYSSNNCLIRNEGKVLVLGCADGVIPEEVRAIGEFALSGCTFTEYTVPDFIEEMSHSVFNGCSNLEYLELPFVGDGKGGDDQVFGYVFGDTEYKGSTLVEYRFNTYSASFRIPNSLRTVKINRGDIGAYAFAYLSKLEEVILPEDLTVIGKYAFEKCTNLNQVELPSGLQFIGMYAFSETGLTQIDLPDGLTYIGQYAFSSCKLTEIAIPANLTYMYEAFFNCVDMEAVYITDIAAWCNLNGGYGNALTSAGYLYLNGQPVTELIIPEGVETISNYAFCNAIGIERVVLPTSLKEIGREAFYGCENLTEIEFSTGLLTIGDYAFRGCKKLTEVNLPEGLNKIDGGAFCECEEIESVYIPSSVTYIGSVAFESCRKLEKVQIPADGVTNWCQINFMGYVFNSYADNLSLYVGGEAAEQIYIPDGVTRINDYAFCYFKTITDIRIPDSIEYMGVSALPYNKYESSLSNFNKYEGGLYLGNDNNPYLVLVGTENSTGTSFTINENTAVIYEEVFAGRTYLSDIALPQGLKFIGQAAFRGTALTSVVIPDGTLYVGGYAFSNCDNLKEVVVPNSSISMGEYVFAYNAIETATVPLSAFSQVSNSKLKTLVLTDGEVMPEIWDNLPALESVTLPEGMQKISNNAFKRCTNLRYLSIPDSIETIGYSAFPDSLQPSNYSNGAYYLGSRTNPYAWLIKAVGNLTEIEVNSATKHIYCDAFYGCTDLEKVVLPEGLLTVGFDAFRGCSSLSGITIPESVKTISLYAFADCTSLEKITLPSQSVVFDRGIFSRCSALKEVTLPADLTALPDRLFGGCTALERIVIPDGVTAIGSGVFEDCTSLKSVIIPNGATKIGGSAFSGCTSLKSIVIPNGVTEINSYVFSGCTSLENVVIPESVKKIGDYAFKDCTSLTQITVPVDVIPGPNAFDNCPAAPFTEYGNALYFGTEENPYLWLMKSAGYGVSSVEIHPDTVYIAEGAFYACTNLSEVTIPEGVMYIGKRAFYWTWLSEVVLPSTVKSIGEEAFANTQLKNVSIPDGIEYIGKDAFSSSYLQYNIYKNCKYLGNENSPYLVFCGTVGSDIYTITIAEGTRAIHGSLFRYWGSAVDGLAVIVPDSVEFIGAETFLYLNSKAIVVIGSGVKYIDALAFSSNDGNGYRVYYNGTQSEWDEINIVEPNGISDMPICFYAESKPEEDGYYWHYDTAGKPVKW